MVKVVITGRPGSGKTTVFMKVIETLKSQGISVTGFYCPEVREGGVRIGFRIVDIGSGESDWLALEVSRAMSLGYKSGPRVGKYLVLEDRALRIGLNALSKVGCVDVLAIDELGPMELRISELRRHIIQALSKARNALLVVHWRLSDNTLLRLLADALRYTVTPANRTHLPQEIVSTLMKHLKS